MPSFDIVSEVDMHEVNNAVDQSNREVGTRFDFKGVDAKFEVTDQSILVVSAEVDFQVKQMLEILRGKLVKRGVDIKALVEDKIEVSGQKASNNVKNQQVNESEIARKIENMVKKKRHRV